uniref:Uncharacterized protein n=1 Tax=Arundo donax TaxID=35708 RepID=A0A0A9CVM1_ARUDO
MMLFFFQSTSFSYRGFNIARLYWLMFIGPWTGSGNTISICYQLCPQYQSSLLKHLPCCAYLILLSTLTEAKQTYDNGSPSQTLVCVIFYLVSVSNLVP